MALKVPRILRGLKKTNKSFLMQFDGNAKPNPGNISCGIAFFSPELREELYEIGYYEKGNKNNNDSECIALIKGLEFALEHDMYNLMIEGDSQFAISMLNSKVPPKGPYKEYFEKIQLYGDIFDTISIIHIPRSENNYADSIARKAYDFKKNFITEFVKN
jgi:ribonuclease HI